MSDLLSVILFSRRHLTRLSDYSNNKVNMKLKNLLLLGTV